MKPPWLANTLQGACRRGLSFCVGVRVPVCQSASLSVYQSAGLPVRKKFSPYALTISSKGVFDPLITMVTSEFRQNVPFGRYKHFLVLN